MSLMQMLLGTPGAGASPPWTPASLSPALWLDASSLGSLTINGSNQISQWNDLSGNARHVSQGSLSLMPTLSGSSVVFNGGQSLGRSSYDITGLNDLSGAQFSRVLPTPGNGPSAVPYLFPITAGRTYEFHTLARPIGCQVRVMIGFWDASLNFISQTPGATTEITSTATPDARELSAYTQLWVRSTAPANAAYAGCIIDMTAGGQTSVTDPKMIWTRAYFGETKPDAMGPTPYVPPSSFGRLSFQGEVYQPVPVQMTGIAWSGRGPAPRPRAAVANIGGVLTSLLATYGDLVGAKVTRITTYRKFLDDQPTADPTSYWEPDIWRIERKVVQTPQLVEWELASILDQEGRRLPGRHMLRDACPWIYRRWAGTGFDYSTATCPYTGTAYFTVNGDQTGNPADGCRSQGDPARSAAEIAMFSSLFGAVIASPLARRLAMFAAIALVLVGLLGWVRLEMAWRHAAEERAEAAEAAVAARDRSIAALEEAMAEAERRRSRLEPIRRAVNAAPITNACVASPAVRAVIDGLRAAPNAGAGNLAPVPSPAVR